MPTQDGFRPNDLHCSKKAWVNSSHPYEHSNGQLATEKQNLGLKPAPRLEQVSNKHSERMQDRKHRSQ
jgi:hypothetical protein